MSGCSLSEFSDHKHFGICWDIQYFHRMRRASLCGGRRLTAGDVLFCWWPTMLPLIRYIPPLQYGCSNVLFVRSGCWSGVKQHVREKPEENAKRSGWAANRLCRVCVRRGGGRGGSLPFCGEDRHLSVLLLKGQRRLHCYVTIYYPYIRMRRRAVERQKTAWNNIFL